jgi:hypothetical protein
MSAFSLNTTELLRGSKMTRWAMKRHALEIKGAAN